MAMIDSTNIVDFQGRPRRIRHDSAKNYDGEGEKSLELRGILDVLSAYRDYDGGVNCSLCGKLYKSKVCFIKHLWEHSIYWDLFPGDKNHERVLAIQAALILYSGKMGVSMQDAERLMDLLVTSPNIPQPTSSHHALYPTTPKKPLTPPVCPARPCKDVNKRKQSHLHDQRTPRKKLRLDP